MGNSSYLCNRKRNKLKPKSWKGNKIMKTLNELKSFCEKNNVRYEMNPIYSEPSWMEQLVKDENGNIRFTMVEHRTLIGYEFGMNNIAGKKGRSEWQWVWFESIACFDEPKDDTQFWFRERYSMVNGETHKGWREMFNAENTIERRMA